MTNKRKTILLIEDDREIINIYKIAFEKVDHFKLETIVLGQEALEWIKKVKNGEAKKPDLILLDLILPDMNGLNVLKKIREEEKTKNIPVFILTNYTDREMRNLGYDLNVEQYLVKTEWVPSKLVPLIKERLKDRN